MALTALLVTQIALPAAAAQAGNPCEWAPDAPDQHRVQQGDTLWGLASVFLKDPWCWPRVWEQNRDQIRNPHWIYPGQVVVLDRARGVLRLSADERRELPSSRLAPAARIQAIENARIPVLPAHLQRRLTHAPLLLGTRTLDSAPVIASLPENRTLAAEGDSVLVRGDPGNQQQFDVVRPSKPLIDPDSQAPLGSVGQRVGQVTLQARGTLSHRFLVVASDAEIQQGDTLIPTRVLTPAPMALHTSDAPAGKVAAVLHDGRWAGPGDLVAINRGASHGLAPGSVVKVVRQVRIRADEHLQPVHAPDDSPAIALLLVFDIAEQVSLAIVMRARDTIAVGDTVLPP